MLSKDERDRLTVLVAELSRRDQTASARAEEELLYWCLSSKDALETLKKQKRDVTLSGLARYKISNMIAVATTKKHKMRCC